MKNRVQHYQPFDLRFFHHIKALVPFVNKKDNLIASAPIFHRDDSQISDFFDGQLLQKEIYKVPFLRYIINNKRVSVLDDLAEGVRLADLEYYLLAIYFRGKNVSFDQEKYNAAFVVKNCLDSVGSK